ncbi:kinesin-like protein KIF19 isoform X2 [Vespa crabro]|uniref:kinesin-like protein KIF19 isoform X2 n=1 Tax=Vespa crabro TaxID=7445 RepID=UPI001F00483B|nr:kinesin-like protein KIF19 isoform X2 [Vespa crabro]
MEECLNRILFFLEKFQRSRKFVILKEISKMTQYSSSGSSSSTSSNGHRDFKDRSSKAIEEKLRVAVRIRPLTPGETCGRTLHAINDKMVMLEEVIGEKSKRSFPRQYLYDIVFGEDATQEIVYEGTTKNLVQDVLNGYNATVFAYGATGAGKTHTMVGTSSDPGIMVRALNDIFLTTQKLMNNVEFTVTMSYVEIYNENIRDLLNPTTGYLELREDSRGRNVQVSGLTEVSTNSTEEVMQLLHKGNKARMVEPTAANETSSRSHALLSVTVRQSSSPVKESGQRLRTKLKQGRLFMIDLAGSERAKQTQNKGKRLQEGAHINRSLLALSNCIKALSGGARFVNYRDSKLTRLLKEALGGNCRTVMIAHVSPANVHRDESKNTLNYADRANKISNKVERNVLDVSYLHVAQYQDIISDLKSEISRLRNKMKEDRPSDKYEEKEQDGHGSDFRSLREKIVSAFKEQMRLRKKLMELDSHLLGLNIAAEQQHSIISQWESRNNRVYGSNRDSVNRRPGTDYQVEEVDDIEDIDFEDDSLVQQAWAELAEISKEQERYVEMRAATEKELEACRKRSAALEDELPSRINSDEERELLALMLRVHELEADKMMLQSERLVKQHELRRRELLLLRYDRQRQISDEIITRQRRIMEDGRLTLPPDLQNLYALYQQEIQAATYVDSNLADLTFSSLAFGAKLPPISSRLSYDTFNNDSRIPSSSTDSDWDQSPLPPIQEPPDVERVMGPVVQPLISPAVLFPPIPSSNSRNQIRKLRRIASDDSMDSVRFSQGNNMRYNALRRTDERETPS